MISMLISAGYSDAAVVLRTDHRDTTSLQSYHNFRGEQGEQQLQALFGGECSVDEDVGNTIKRASVTGIN